MEIETNQTPPQGEYLSLEKSRWSAFFEAITHTVEGKQIEIEVAGLDLGDQLEAEHVVLSGVTYDRKDDTLYVYATDVERNLGHAISHPREILVSWRAGILERIVVTDADEHLHVITLREALPLPSLPSPHE